MNARAPSPRGEAAENVTPNDGLALAIRSVSNWVLTTLAASGVVGGTAILLLWPARWPVGLLLVAAAAVGLWGLVDRVLPTVRHYGDGSHKTPPARFSLLLLLALRWLSAVIGVAVLAGFVIFVVGVVLGGGWV